MLLFASYHYSERTRVTDWWRKTPDKSFLSTSVFVAVLLSYSLTLRQLRSYSLTWGSCSYSVTSNNRKRLLKIAQCEPGLRRELHDGLMLVERISGCFLWASLDSLVNVSDLRLAWINSLLTYLPSNPSGNHRWCFIERNIDIDLVYYI